jgi:hypothetical protein
MKICVFFVFLTCSPSSYFVPSYLSSHLYHAYRVYHVCDVYRVYHVCALIHLHRWHFEIGLNQLDDDHQH